MPRKKSEAELRASVHRYGKQVFNEKEQTRILYFILEDAKNKLVKDSETYKLIAENQLNLEKQENLKEAIRIINQFVIALEAKDQDGATVNYLKKHGFYRILYRNPRIMGEELPSDDILHKLLRNGFIGVAVRW